MELDRRPTHRLLRVDDGSAIVEGLAALSIAFVLLALIVQVTFAATARNAAESAVAASARRAARANADLAQERTELARVIAATVPGAREADVTVRRDLGTATATARFRWDPPGPAWLPITIRVRASVATAVPP